MAVGYFNCPILGNNDPETTSSNSVLSTTSSSPSSNPFHSCWSPIQKSNAIDQSWQAVRDWIDSAQDSNYASDRQSSRSNKMQNMGQKNELLARDRKTNAVPDFWGKSSSISDNHFMPAYTSNAFSSNSMSNRSSTGATAAAAPLLNTDHLSNLSRIRSPKHQSQYTPSPYFDGEREYNLIQDLLKLNIEGCSHSSPEVSRSAVSAHPSSQNQPKLSEILSSYSSLPITEYPPSTESKSMHNISPNYKSGTIPYNNNDWPGNRTKQQLFASPLGPSNKSTADSHATIGSVPSSNTSPIRDPIDPRDPITADFMRHQFILGQLYHLLAEQVPYSPLQKIFDPNARRSVATLELHVRLEQCSDQYRQLEKERKKTEAELARHHLGKKISSTNSMPIPRLVQAPSRIDRLIVDFFREHARVVTLLAKMEQLRGAELPEVVHVALRELLEAVKVLQQCRNTERNMIIQQLRGEIVRLNDDSETNALSAALLNVCKAVIRARSANWCSLVWTIGMDSDNYSDMERILRSDFKSPPPEIKHRPI